MDTLNNHYKKAVRLVATDLDGTFLRNDHSVSERNIHALHKLGEKQITRVAATGRNLQKVKEVISGDIPFDFIVFSSGAGVFDWKKKKHLYLRNIDENTAQLLIRFFQSKKLGFHAFYPAPDNHNHWFSRGEVFCEEFERYFHFNKANATILPDDQVPGGEICQFLLIIPEDLERFNSLKNEIESQFDRIRVIRTSSPVTRGYIWMEIFHNSVSKGNGVKFLCEMLSIDRENTLGIGNDYNDLDMLEFTGLGYLTGNAPEEIKNYYPDLPTNEQDAFAFAVQPFAE